VIIQGWVSDWGITRLKGGFVLAHVGATRKELVDARSVSQSVEQCRKLFGRAPRDYAYDRAGHSEANVAKLRELGVHLRRAAGPRVGDPRARTCVAMKREQSGLAPSLPRSRRSVVARDLELSGPNRVHG
jgi:hypothetical protein